jgi:DNA-binding response OmpR family regulator
MLDEKFENNEVVKSEVVKSEAAKCELKFGYLLINIRSKTVKVKNSVIPLTKSEYEILLMLASDPTTVYSRQQIVNAMWDNPGSITVHTVAVHIANLRKKLGQGSCCILSRKGFGYIFNSCALTANRKKKTESRNSDKRISTLRLQALLCLPACLLL